ncbi:GNAT family N-acetyltransferase [Myroides sp. M-43]|uniref:GNAT family N-acetyltransferase n=1 Tax=Myroides oncorhynchi TaxID=2893756 RepID=UPI001E58885A|nr:GNAT family N-acetyltransferase [Myroides oncorhynchi]MCC9042836.1 GNAT family N-acetyltransferase [Myroides oncorhynchi]
MLYVKKTQEQTNIYLTKTKKDMLFTTNNLKIERIILEKDSNILLQIHNCKETMQWIPTNINHWDSKELAKKYNKNKELYESNLGMYKISLKIGENTEIIGELLLQEYNDNSHTIEISYLISKNYWKQGFGTELLIGLEEFLKHKKIELVAQLYEENTASRHLLEKLNYSLLAKDSIENNKYKLTYSKVL